jgi:uncharacterized protein DUF2190
MADYAPVNGADLAEALTFTAGAPITGGQVLVFSAADTVIPAAGASLAFAGVAGHDAASGAPVTVHAGAGILHETQTTVAAVAVGALIQSQAAGLIAGGAAAGAEIGVAVRAVSAAGGVLRWKTTRG